MLGEEPTRRRGVVVEAVGAAAAFMVDGASLFASALVGYFFGRSLKKQSPVQK